MAMKKADPIGAKTERVMASLTEAKQERDEALAIMDGRGEKMKTVSFQIRPSDYAALKTVFFDLGLSTGAGIRFALNEFMKNRGAK